MASALIGFTGDSVSLLGTTILPITIGEELRAKTMMITFMVVDLPSAYNVILGRPTLNKLKAVVSTYHRAIKFLTLVGVGVSQSDPRESRQCYLTSVTLLEKSRPQQAPEPHKEARTPTHLEPPEQLAEVLLKRYRPDMTMKVRTTLPEANQLQLVNFLKRNADVFTWSSKDMPGIDPGVTQHHLNIHPEARPVKQKPRKFAPDRQKAISDEFNRLREAGFITEVKYPRWLPNVVLVKKHSGSWRMCVDYTDLNRACSKDCYPFSMIDQLVDATVGYELIIFMDVFSGYNQIRMAP
ncbi:uncharacterized protein LOC135636345 [Musa acuminata AAA Group]|uniref:uncharacterized protein LOC135636345 n=1 Tax=Musa acuminata AAA Group TaxID=214697 RepID=UPI0031D00CDA